MSGPLTIAERAFAAVVEQLATITVANGYRTDAGLAIYDSVRTIRPTKAAPYALVVWDDTEETEEGDGQHSSFQTRLKLSIDFFTLADQVTTGEMLRAGKADVKRCLMSWAWKGGVRDSDGKIGGLFYNGAKSSARLDGVELESVSFDFTISFKEGWGNPYSNTQ